MRLAALAVVCLLAVPIGNGYWTQLGGDAGHSGRSALAPDALDVVALGQLVPAGEWMGAGGRDVEHIVDTPHGPVFLTNTIPTGGLQGIGGVDSLCRMYLVDVQALSTDLLWERACAQGGRLRVYDLIHDAALVAIDNADGSLKTLHSIDLLTGADRWVAGPDASFPANPGPGDTGDIYTSAAVLDETTGVVYAVAEQEGRPTSLLYALNSQDGTARWSTPFGANVVAAAGPATRAAAEATSTWHTRAITLTDSGIIVVANAMPVNAASVTTAAGHFYFDRDGVQTGAMDPAQPAIYTDSPAVDAQTGALTSSYAPSANRDSALFTVENLLVVHDPGAGTGIIEQLPATALRYNSCLLGEPAIWFQDRALVLGGRSAVSYDPTGTPRITEWLPPDGRAIVAGLVDSTGDYYLMLEDRGGQVLSRLDPGLREMQRLHLPLGNANCHAHRLLPTTNPAGLLALSLDGSAAFLAAGAQGPKVDVSDLYPAPGDPVRFVVPGDGADYSIHFGDGSRSSTSSDLDVVHTYAEGGTYRVFITAVAPDQTTATTVTQVFVGGTPPQNWLQQRFAPGNQDMTWGVIGVLLFLFGAIVTILARRLGRGRIATGLRTLDQIRELGKDDAPRALQELQQWHRRQEDRLLRGRLTEDQFRVLEGRGTRLLRSLTDTVLANVSGTLPAPLQRRLQASYADGFVDPAEVSQLWAALKAARLTPKRHAAVASLLDAWA